MDTLVEALLPVIVASFAIQQLIELLDPILDAAIRGHKKWILSALTLVISLVLAFGLKLRVLAAIGHTGAPILDGILTALFMTGGTKGINDLLKLIGYRKEQAKSRLTPEQAARV